VQAAEIRLGSLSLDWPAGYAVKSTQPPFELTGPSGAKVLVTVMRPGASAASGPEAQAKVTGMVERMMTTEAQKAGKVVVPLGGLALPDGTQLRFTGSEVSRLLRSGYFLQYVLLAANGQIAFVTFEGSGEATREHEATRQLFQTVRWDAGEGSAADRVAFTDKVAGLLRARLTDKDVAIAAEPLTLKVGELQANLDRVFGYCRANAQGCDEELQRYVQAIVEMRSNAATPVTKDALRLVVCPADYAGVASPTAADDALRRPLVTGLVALPVVDGTRSARLMIDEDCKKLGLSPAQAHELARANLRTLLKPLSDVAKPVKRGAIGTLGGDFYESSRVLLTEDWAPLAQAQAGVLVVALPAKDVVLYSSDDSSVGLDALRTYAREVARRSASQLTDVLLRWTPSGWQATR
jgi:hypothetical protein